jgi:hypothetical protein
VKLKLVSDSIQGAKAVIYLDGQKVCDVTGLQINMTPMGLNTVVLQRYLDGAEVTMDLYGGEAFKGLRDASVAMLRRLSEADPEYRAPFAGAMMLLRDAVEAVQDEVAG